MSLVAVAPLAAFASNTAHAHEVSGHELVFVRNGDDVYALDDLCSHAEVALSEGEVDGCFIECWMHGSAFDVRTGEPNCPPATKAVRTYPVSINDQDGTPTVFVEIG